MSCKYFTNTFKILISVVKHILCTVVEEQKRILFKRFLTLVDALKMAPKSKKYKTSYSDEMKSAFSFNTKCSSSVPDYQDKYHCTICNLNLSFTSGSSNDILRHLEKRQSTSKVSKKLSFLLKPVYATTKKGFPAFHLNTQRTPCDASL